VRTVTHSHTRGEHCNALSCPVAAASAKYPHGEQVNALWPEDSAPFQRSRKGVCWCGEVAVSGGKCNAHSEFNVGDG